MENRNEREFFDRVINRLFEVMSFTYGEKFKNQWSGLAIDDVKNHWKNALANYSVDEIKTGVEALNENKYPPTLPEFLALCRPSLNVENAYYEAVKGLRMRIAGNDFKFSHPAVYFAGCNMQYELLNFNYEKNKNAWKIAFEKEMKKGKWNEIPKVVKIDESMQIELDTSISKETEDAIKAIKMLVSSSHITKRDPKAWAWRLKEKYDNDPNSISLMQKQYAEAALETKF